LYGCETWSFNFEGKHRWKIFEKKDSEEKGEELAGSCRKFHIDELPIVIRVIKWRNVRWTRHVTRMGGIRNAYNILVGKPEWKM
jgi:hypothetical protein